MSLLDRQRAIRSADAALREADLPMYADVVVSLHRLIEAVEKLSAEWPGKNPPNVQAKRVMHYALEGKEITSVFLRNPVEYERIRRQARDEMMKLIAIAKKLASSPGRLGNDDIPHIDDIDF